MKKLLVVLGVILGGIVLLAMIAGGSYNRLVRLQTATDGAWAQVQNVYQRRADLIPNLVATVSGAANFEKSTITEVTAARASVGQIKLDPNKAPTDAATLEQFDKAQKGLSSALSRLLVVVEKYPDLKATSNFRDLQAQLEGTENRIAVERGRFNETVQSYNAAIKSVPAVFYAGIAGFKERPYFTATPGAEAPPKVQFDFNSQPPGHAREVNTARRLFIVLLLALGCVGVGAEVIPPAPAQYFNDYAKVVSPNTAQQLNLSLANFERETSSQIVVAVYPKMQSDSSIEDYTVRVAQSWRVGQKKKDNGVVLFVFINDRKLFIQVGYGLEGALPDALCKRIIEDEIKPHFKAGDYNAGLTAGVKAILAATKGEYKGTGLRVVDLSSPRSASHGSNSPFRPILIIIMFFIFLIIVSRFGRRRRGFFYTDSGWGGSSGGWSSGGGGFSDGGGGFSGGGGSFGGGGAGGSW